MTCNRKAAPKLGGVIGRKAGSLSDYDGYSKAMARTDVTWTLENLAAFLREPESLIPRGIMVSGWSFTLAPEEERQKVLQFIQDPDDSNERCWEK